MISSEPEQHGSDDEILRVLRLGCTTVYRMAREYLVPGGRSGIPVVKSGRKRCVPREKF